MIHVDLHDFLGHESAALPRTTTLFRESGLRTMLLHLKPGERIPEHQTRGALLVQCVAGRGSFFITTDRLDLRPGLLISVPPAVPHSVVAADDEGMSLLVAVSEETQAQP